MQAEKLEKLKKLLDDGAITKDEFEVQKNLILREGTKGKRYGLIVGICVTIVICLAIITAGNPNNNIQNSSAGAGTQTVGKTDSDAENIVYSSEKEKNERGGTCLRMRRFGAEHTPLSGRADRIGCSDRYHTRQERRNIPARHL